MHAHAHAKVHFLKNFSKFTGAPGLEPLPVGTRRAARRAAAAAGGIGDGSAAEFVSRSRCFVSEPLYRILQRVGHTSNVRSPICSGTGQRLGSARILWTRVMTCVRG
jgi:hypothetical protein